MHRHGYQGRKLQRAAGPRKALIRGQITSLILHEAITTTEAKAKEVRPYFERLVTKAKQANLAGERAVRQTVLTEPAAQKLVRELAPAWSERQGGYTRIIKLANRRGDNAPLARLALVLEDVSAGPAAVGTPVPPRSAAADTGAPASGVTRKDVAAKTTEETAS